MERAYRKKPVVVEAIQWTGENHAEMCEFIDPEVFEIKPKEGLIIHTLEGDHHASPGDYIIKGVNGEFYPCKPDIFAKTYEPVTLTPQNDPLTIEELREMYGEPVYIISEFYHISEWNIPNGIGEIVIAYDVPCVGMKEVISSIKFIDGKELAVEKYGSSWFAYENKDGAVPQKGEFEWTEETS